MSLAGGGPRPPAAFGMLTSSPPPRRRRLRAPSFSLAIPSILWYVFFFVLPILLIVWYSFGLKDTSSTSGVPVDMAHRGLQNYRDAFDPTFFTVFKSTLKVSVIATTLCFVFGFPVAYFLVFKVTEKWKGIMLALIVVPSFTSFLIRTLAWRIPLAANGEFSKWLQDVGMTRRADQRARHEDGSADRDRLQLPRLHDPAVVRCLRSHRSSHARGEQRPRRQSTAHVPAGDHAVGGSRCCRRSAADVHPDVRRLRHGDAARWHVGQHDRRDDRQPVPRRPELATRLGDGRDHDRRGARWCSSSAASSCSARSGSFAVAGTSRSRAWHDRRHRRSAYADGQSALNATAPRSSWPIWATIVLTFLFIPILLVIRHSFNRGGSFIVWAHHYSTKWWGLLFNVHKTWNAILVFFGIVVVVWLIARVTEIKLLRRWSIPLGVALGVIVNGVRTEWYTTLFNESGLGLALRNSFTAAIGGTAIAVILGGLAGVALARRTGNWSKPFMFVLFLILVTPEIMDAIALLGLVRPSRWSVQQPGRADQQRHPALVGRPVAVHLGLGHAHRPRPTRRARRVVGRGRRRSRCAARRGPSARSPFH